MMDKWPLHKKIAVMAVMLLLLVPMVSGLSVNLLISQQNYLAYEMERLERSLAGIPATDPQVEEVFHQTRTFKRVADERSRSAILLITVITLLALLMGTLVAFFMVRLLSRQGPGSGKGGGAGPGGESRKTSKGRWQR
ncbi:MAG: hypothetical protein HQL52_10085 [Magnetococcales bacterium]|nr:hypothetical protein [Magnetococcales bacterium]